MNTCSDASHQKWALQILVDSATGLWTRIWCQIGFGHLGSLVEVIAGGSEGEPDHSGLNGSKTVGFLQNHSGNGTIEFEQEEPARDVM